MKILLIGHSIIDHFEELGSEISKPGGLFYTSLGILSSKSSDDKIFLLTSWNKKSFHLFEHVYSKCNLKFSAEYDDMPEVYLKSFGEGEREETYKNLSVQLSIEQLQEWNQFYGILINMITGFDLSIEQLGTIRKNYRGIIYFDVHTLSRGVDPNMKRIFRPIPEIEKWLTNIDILQCNENELHTIIQNENEAICAERILSGGPKILIVTKSSNGATAYFKELSETKSVTVVAEKIEEKNKIGCGDIFGAVFFYSYISTRNVSYSLMTANKAGGRAAATLDLSTYSEINFND